MGYLNTMSILPAASRPELLPLPRHVAVIMDGNGRWARRRGMIRWDGHSAGAEAVRATLESAAKMGVEYLTLYAFSVNNWSRPRLEVEALMRLLTRFARKEQAELIRQDIRVQIVGHLDRLPKTPRDALTHLVEATTHCRGTTLSLALSYGGRQDIVEATQKLVAKAQAGLISAEQVTVELLQQHMSTNNLPDVDLLIRTGGESRISDFLLFEAAYAELRFVDVMWPDFRAKHFEQAIDDYRGVERRYGLTSEQIESGELSVVG